MHLKTELKYMRQKLVELQGEIDGDTDFSTPLSIIEEEENQ